MLRSVLRSPLLHFLLLGTLLFVARATPRASGDDAAGPISIAPERLGELERGFAEQTGRRPGPRETARIIEQEVEEEILYREAIARGLLETDGGVRTRLIQKMLFLEGDASLEQAPALLERAALLGLHREDVVVRRILVQKMRLIASALRADQRPTEADLRAAYAEGADRLRGPDRIDLTHVFLSADRRGPAVEADARALRTRLVAGEIAAEAAATAGDPFPLGHRLEDHSAADLDARFGGRFGEAVFDTPSGGWSEPIESAYGWHLVRVSARTPGRVPPFEAVAARLRLELEADRREANLDAWLRERRASAVVEVDGAPAPPPSRLENG